MTDRSHSKSDGQGRVRTLLSSAMGLVWSANPFADRPAYPVSARMHAILDEWRLLPPSTANDPASLIMKRLDEQQGADGGVGWTWDDLEGAKMALVMLYPETRLRRWIWCLRDEFKSLAGEAMFAAYIASPAPDPKSAPLDELRQDALQLLNELRKLYRVLPEQEQTRSRLALRAALVAAAILVGGVGLFFVWPWMSTVVNGQGGAASNPPVPSGMPMLPIVILCGALGGAISAQQRIQNSLSDTHPSTRVFFIANRWGSIYLAPVLGGIFAAVAYVLIASQLIGGSLFPKINVPSLASLTPAGSTAGTSMTMTQFALATGPAEGVDIAKLLVWSLIAGFAERLVPDTLDRLAASAREG